MKQTQPKITINGTELTEVQAAVARSAIEDRAHAVDDEEFLHSLGDEGPTHRAAIREVCRLLQPQRPPPVRPDNDIYATATATLPRRRP